MIDRERINEILFYLTYDIASLSREIKNIEEAVNELTKELHEKEVDNG